MALGGLASNVSAGATAEYASKYPQGRSETLSSRKTSAAPTAGDETLHRACAMNRTCPVNGWLQAGLWSGQQGHPEGKNCIVQKAAVHFPYAF